MSNQESVDVGAELSNTSPEVFPDGVINGMSNNYEDSIVASEETPRSMIRTETPSVFYQDSLGSAGESEGEVAAENDMQYEEIDSVIENMDLLTENDSIAGGSEDASESARNDIWTKTSDIEKVELLDDDPEESSTKAPDPKICFED